MILIVLALKIGLIQGWKVNIFNFRIFLYLKFYKYINVYKLNYNFEKLKIFQNINGVLVVFKSLENKLVFIYFLGFSAAETRIRKVVQINGVHNRILLGSIS